jgi:protein-S-isoprenylcysteine O-methyltransferase Ste14
MIMFWLVLAVLLWGLFHSLLASLKAKELARRWLGNRVARFYRLGYNVFACVSFLPVLGVAALTPDRRLYLVPLPWSGLMVLGELLAVAALVVGFRQTDAWEFLGLRPANRPVEKRQGALVTGGLYRHVRHPLYSAGLAFIWLMPLMTVNVLAINIALTVYVISGAYLEERKLLREFGGDYAEYAAATPMFIPFLKGNKSDHATSGD